MQKTRRLRKRRNPHFSPPQTLDDASADFRLAPIATINDTALGCPGEVRQAANQAAGSQQL